MRRTIPLEKRLASKITIHPETDCWIWKGAKNNFGYGVIYADGKTKKATRVTYEKLRGPIPDGLVLDHFLYPGACVGPGCVNPNHLVPTTRSANAGRTAWARRTHCPKGHEYTPENTIIEDTHRGRGKGRRCKKCHYERIARWQAKNPEKVNAYQQKAAQRRKEKKAASSPKPLRRAA